MTIPRTGGTLGHQLGRRPEAGVEPQRGVRRPRHRRGPCYCGWVTPVPGPQPANLAMTLSSAHRWILLLHRACKEDRPAKPVLEGHNARSAETESQWICEAGPPPAGIIRFRDARARPPGARPPVLNGLLLSLDPVDVDNPKADSDESGQERPTSAFLKERVLSRPCRPPGRLDSGGSSVPGRGGAC